MCGIAGWVDWRNDLTQQADVLEGMAETMCHRGPDAQGQWLSPHAALVHRRLIVIDPPTGGQPMIYRQGDWVYAITYNGEIYNFRELQRELQDLGHTFHTQSDTEVVLHAYAEWGEACIPRLNGIFAFGLWDEQKQQLLLARDHLGVKPLFYARRGTAILFSSELKTLLAHPEVKAEIDAQGLAQILTFAYVPDSGVYRNISQLRPGHLAVCDEQHMRVTRYWSFRSAPHPDDVQTTVEHIKTLLADIVKRQLISDVPIVTLLSGGLDSSGLTALAAAEFQREGKQLHTYSVDLVDSARHFRSSALHPTLDAPYVQQVSEYVGTQHRTILVDTPALVENLLAPMRARDMPALGQMETSLYLLFQAMKQDATVALSGESADEIFGGYPWFHMQATLDAQTFPWTMALSGRGEAALSWLSPHLLEAVRIPEHLDQRYRAAIAEVPRLAGETGQAARMREMFYLNLTGFLVLLLERKDRMSMASGFEVRVPFCDYRLMEYVWNIPWEMKNVDGIEKGILRRALAGLLPDDVRVRRKSGYPTFQNPAYLAATRDWAWQIINNANEPIHPYLNGPLVRTLMANPDSALAEWGLVTLFERVIQFNEWLKEYRVSVQL
jgi:asparagine synthase (glutamine-hydrolysing)